LASRITYSDIKSWSLPQEDKLKRKIMDARGTKKVLDNLNAMKRIIKFYGEILTHFENI
tara:strand:+ start:446 stop:622 length:177 start_codon:yes stop_codon:yes gene_type:complete